MKGGQRQIVLKTPFQTTQAAGKPRDQAAIEFPEAPMPGVTLRLGFFLWRQTQLNEPLLQCRQAGLGVLAETPLELPRLPEFSELPGFLTPSGQIDLRQLRGGDGL